MIRFYYINDLIIFTKIQFIYVLDWVHYLLTKKLYFVYFEYLSNFDKIYLNIK